MNTTAKTIAAAIASLSIMGSGSAFAVEMEHCFGVAKAGKNDCKTKTSSCVGTSKTDNQKDAFIATPKGLCDKIAGGSLESS